MSGMGRREFVALIGGAVATSPSAARAQQSAMPAVRNPDEAAYRRVPTRALSKRSSKASGKPVMIRGWERSNRIRRDEGQYDRLTQTATGVG